MKKGKISVPIAIALALSLLAVPAFAGLPVEQKTKTKGATTITWDSSFVETEYTLGDTLLLDVNWSVDAGAAEFHSFVLRLNRRGKGGFTPPKDVLGTSTDSGTNPVELTVTFTELHFDADRQCLIGNAHFKLYLMIDEDGDGTTETLAGYGVNVHVEDPVLDATECRPPVPDDGDGGDGGGGGGGGGGGNGRGGGIGNGVAHAWGKNGKGKAWGKGGKNK